MPAGDALDLVNMVGGRAGLTSRLGYEEWVTGLDSEVRTVIPFKGSMESGTKDRLFACTRTGIWDCTISSDAPTRVYTFPTQSDDSGWGVATAYVTIAGYFLCYFDEANGYLLYTESTNTWTLVAAGASAGQIGGVNPRNLAFGMVWKNRLMMVEKDTGNLWYLPVGEITGTVEAIRLGNRFKAGGALRGLWSWTIDGGAGVDDHLVAISGGGDVLVYAGDDPAVAGAFNLIGSWYLGAIPHGRRIATDYGGDLLVLSRLGIIPMSRLRSGTVGPDGYATRKIQALFNSYAGDRGSLNGWSLRISPEDNALLVNMPLVGNTYEQLALSLATQGWSLFKGVPSVCSEVWQGSLYFGTPDGRVCAVTGDLDGVKLNGAATYSEIEWSGLTSFSDFGHTSYKQIQEIEPLLWTQGPTPGYVVEARYDFNTAALSTAPTPPSSAGVATWGSAKWGSAVWPGSDRAVGSVRGATGMGRHAAIAFRGRSNARTTLMGFRVRLTDGGTW